MKPRILISGAAGYLGSYLAHWFGCKGYQIIAQTCSSPLPRSLQDLTTLHVQCDLRDASILPALMRETSPTWIVHCAAESNAGACEQDPAHAMSVNRDLSRVLAEELYRHSPESMFIQISTDLVFDGRSAPAGGFVESAEPEPASVYGKSKRLAEVDVLEVHPRSVVARTCLLYGPQIASRGGAMAWLRSGFAHGTPLGLFVDEYRTPVFLEDVATALSRICARVSAVPGAPAQRMVHLAGAERISRFEFGRLYAAAFGYSEECLHAVRQGDVPSRAPRSPDVSLAARRSEAAYDFSTVGAADGVERWGNLERSSGVSKSESASRDAIE